MEKDRTCVRQQRGKTEEGEDLGYPDEEVDDGSSAKLSALREIDTVTLDRKPFEDLFRDITDVLRRAKEQFQKEFSKNEEMAEESRTNSTVQNGYVKDDHSTESDKRRRMLPQVEFKVRNSLLTDLFEINHFRTIYNIFFVMLLILFLNTAFHDILENGTTHFGLKTVKTGFGKIQIAVQVWLSLFLWTLVTYFGFSVWGSNRYKFVPKSLLAKIWDYGFLIAFICNQVAFVVLPGKYIIEENMPPASSLMILMEQIRMLMKTHAFVRSTAPRFLPMDAEKNTYARALFPTVSMYLYFLFAPTLVYSDTYPRTKHTNWRTVLWSFIEVFLIIFYVAFIFERFLMPPFEKFGAHIFEPKAVILTIFGTTLPGLIMYLFGFYCILHSWQNCGAELLKFGDRLFYKDWWNCTSYDAYYRTWNIIVHNWLYLYIYKDVYEKWCHSKFYASLMTFFVSAVVHEYILALAFRFFYPVMLLMFGGFGVVFVILTKNYKAMNGNVFIWFTLFTGNGILFTLYTMEYYARLMCPPSEPFLVDLLLPRSWICHDGSNNTVIVDA